jgi:hypothetical protein
MSGKIEENRVTGVNAPDGEHQETSRFPWIHDLYRCVRKVVDATRDDGQIVVKRGRRK